MPAGPCSRWTMRRSSCSPLSRCASRRVDVGQRLIDRGVRAPREPARDLGVAGEREQRGRVVAASAGAGSAWDHATRCWRCCSTSTATYRRWRPCSTTPVRPAPTATCSAGDYAVFGGWPAETVARLRELPDATWIRGNVDRWAATEAPDGEPARSGVRGLPGAAGRRDGRAARRAARERRPRRGTRAWHASPKTDLASFWPEPGDDELELLDGVEDRRLVFGHFHVSFDRIGAHEIELVAPGGGRHPARRRPPRRVGAHARRRAHRAPARRLRLCGQRRARARGRRRRPVGRRRRRAHRARGVGIAARSMRHRATR